MPIQNTIFDLSGGIANQVDSKLKTSGTIYAVIQLDKNGDVADGRFWSTDSGGSWQASPTGWPTATHQKSGMWTYALPAAATNGKAGGSLHYTFTDNIDDPGSATVLASYKGPLPITVEDPLTTSDLLTESDIQTEEFA